MSTTHTRRKQNEGAAIQTEDQDALFALFKLNQPWNPVVQCAIDFLKTPSPNKKRRAWRSSLPYAARVYQEGTWQCDNWPANVRLPAEVIGTAIGIVLKGRVEVVIEKPLPSHPAKGVSPILPWPCVTLLPGNVIGLFEYADRFFHSAQAYGYSLLAGPCCIQFDHPDYFAFASDSAGRTALERALNELDKDYAVTRNHHFKAWKETGENYHLIKAFADKEELEKPHAEVLVISMDAFSDLDNYGFNKVIIGAAWLRSGTPLSRTFPVQIRRDSPLQIKGDVDATYAHDVQSTILHVEAAIKDEVPVWTPFHSDYFAPALDSFCNNLAKTIINARVRLPANAVYITNVLSDAKSFGSVSLADHLVKVSEIGKSTKKGTRIEWHDDLAYAQKKNPLFGIERAFKNFLHPNESFGIIPPWNQKVKLRSWNGQKGFSGKSIIFKDASKENPFSRLQIEISSAPNEFVVLKNISSDRNLQSKDLSDVLIVACQHLLKETECWFHHLREINSDVPIMTIGKDYSTCQEISRRLIQRGIDVIDNFEWDWKSGRYGDYLHKKAEMLWQKAQEHLTKNPSIRKVIILDDGAFLISSLPSALRDKMKIVAVEQTQGGISKIAKARNSNVPFINVAECQVKKQVESHFIGKVSLQKAKGICRSLCDRTSKIGIIGYGAVGEALATHLSEVGYTNVYSYDADQKRRSSKNGAQSVNELVDKCEIFFGCTGKDNVLSDVDPALIAGKWFISCSSSDIEFNAFLQSEGAKFMLPYYKFSTVLVTANGKDPAKILNGGFPINFDRTPESVPLNEIQLTRGLMHAGLIQALLEKVTDGSNPLSNGIQREVLNAWLASNNWPEKVKEIAKRALAALSR